MVSGVAGRRLPPAGMPSRLVAEPSQPRSKASRPGPSSGDGDEHDAGRAVAEEDARAAVVGVDDASTASRRR